MDQHPIKWVAPSPLWPELTRPGNGSEPPRFGAPAILRFATDDFMQDFFNILATDPRKLGEFRAVRETWRGKLEQPAIPTPRKLFALHLDRLGNTRRRSAGTGTQPGLLEDGKQLPNLKLYQPAHLRYYLVSACLTCQTPGLPDRRVDAGKQQKVSFVVRRLAANGDENAWVKTRIGFAWMPVRSPAQDRDDIVLKDEERLPLFPATTQEDDQRSRRLFAGLIPVGKREAYLGAQQITGDPNGPAPSTTGLTARKILLRKQVLEPWKMLIAQMSAAQSSNSTSIDKDGNATTIAAKPDGLKAARERVQVLSWLMLLDFAKFIDQYLPDVSTCIEDPSKGLLSGSYQQQLLYVLRSTQVGSELQTALQTGSKINSVASSLADAMKRALDGTKLEGGSTPYQRDMLDAAWPDFLFPLADPDKPAQAPVPQLDSATGASLTDEKDLVDEDTANANAGDTQAGVLLRVDRLGVLVLRALNEYDPQGPASQPDIPAAALPPTDKLEQLFRLRCVYERPMCGPVHDDVVSEPTDAFEMAGFFDPDAPARPIRIGLPIDTTPAGLRKFDKNTAFVMSDVLCGQVKRFRGITFGDLVMSVLPWPFHKDLSAGAMKPCAGSDGSPIGTICSLSIPIITICALILLIIMVTLLDLTFGWLPFLMICFPLPGFKAKKS